MARLAFMIPLAVLAGCGDDAATGGSTSSSTTNTGGAGGGQGGTEADGGGGAVAGGGGEGGAGGSGGPAFTSLGESDYEAQTSIAADGAGNIVVVWRATFIDDDTTSVGYAWSEDAGASWSEPAYLEAPDGGAAINPVVVVDSQGAFSLAFIGIQLTGDVDEHVYFSRFDAGAGTFGDPVNASDDGTSTTLVFDALTATVDESGDVLLGWADFSALATLTFARTADGTSFERSTIVADDTFGNLLCVCLDPSRGPGARLFGVHLGPNKTLTLRTSDDGGETWEVGADVGASEVVFQNPTCVVDGDDLVIAYAAGAADFTFMYDSPGDRIEVVASHDGGASFEPPEVAVEDDPTQYLFPRIARASDGRLEITYYEGIADADATFSHASSADGTTWTQAPILPAGTFALDRSLASWLGAYTGVAIPGDTGFASFTENLEGRTHVEFVEFALP